MDKFQQFLAEVQLGLTIRYAIDGNQNALREDKEAEGQSNAQFSMYAAMMIFDDAVHATSKLPDDITAHDAALQYLEFRLKDDTDPDYRPPMWCLL